MKHCFGYVRVSTVKQGDGVSLEAQKDAIETFASRQSLAISAWYEEKETAAKSGRRVFNAMVRDLKAGKADGLIIHRIDRSSRNLKDWATISDLSDAGVDVHFATETLDFRSRGGRLTADIQAVIAADYIRNLREETRKGIEGRLKQGLYPFRAPLGYLDKGRGQPKTICPVKGPLVRQAFRDYASGQFSLRSLQAHLERLGLRNHGGMPLSLHGVESLLRNPFYTGIIETRRTGAIYQGRHEPLIDRRLFRQVQERREGRAGKKTTRHNHTYRGLFRCGLCGSAMSPELQKGRYCYYRCHQPDCATTCVREEVVEATIEERLASLTLRPEDAKQLEANWLAWLAGDELQGVLQSLDLRIAQVDERLSRLTDLLLDQALTRAEYDERKRKLTHEQIDLVEERSQIARKAVSPETVRKFLELMQSLAQLHRSAKPPEKRVLVENAFSNRRVVGKKVELEPRNWLTERDFAKLSPMVTQLDTLIELAHLRSRLPNG